MATIQTSYPIPYMGDEFGNAPPAAQGGTVACFTNTIAHTDTTSKLLFTLPAGAVIVDTRVDVLTIFNDSGTDLLTVGTVADPDRYVDDLSGASVATTRAGGAATVPVTNLHEAATVAPLAINGLYAGENSDATTGLARVYVWFVTR
jgi:hypothetical protein